ncbi:serine protease [Cadophora sp. MPI-SDFR-AT-0126]|nr:serine protease [Leotiomycetes sp. MPI-SDFR-AT-0126]
MAELVTPPLGEPELIVVFKADSNIHSSSRGLESPASDVSTLNGILDQYGCSIKPLFGLSEDRLRRQQTEVAASAPDDEPVPDLNTFYQVTAPSGTLELLAERLNSEDLVDAAYVKPGGAPPHTFDQLTPEDAPAMTPDFSANQGYLGVAPAGIDARFAWTRPGGGGKGVRVIDCEWAWRFTHEDLLVNQGGVVAGSSVGDSNHGTAVVGVLSGDRNTYGILGIVPDATIGASSFATQATATAIKVAADKLWPGDLILLEIHRPGPRTPNPPQGQLGYIAIEWWPDDFAAIRYAVAKGITVVEAAGNGSQNLDDPIYNIRPVGFPSTWQNPFNAANPSSGAVVVGAGAPPPGTHGRDWGPDRSRLGFSNWGNRVDCQGWGREVTSTGYGDLQGGADPDLHYTNIFSGTSSASPIVTGAIASVQGCRREAGKRHLNPAQIRPLLRTGNSPQQDAPGRPATQRIGPRPNLRTLIPAAMLLP